MNKRLLKELEDSLLRELATSSSNLLTRGQQRARAKSAVYDCLVGRYFSVNKRLLKELEDSLLRELATSSSN